MTSILANPIAPANEIDLVKLPYQAPQLIVIPSMDVENNEGFASDAGLDIGAS